VHRTPREAKAVYPSDWMRKFN